MKTYTVHQAKTQLSRLLQEVARGEEIVILNRDKPVAKLVSPDPPRRNWGFLDAARTHIAPDFDETPEVFSEYLGRRKR